MILKVFFGGSIRNLDLTQFSIERLEELSKSYDDWNIIEFTKKEVKSYEN